MYNWYVARPDELMIDLDHKRPDEPPVMLYSARARLKGASESGALYVRDAWLFPSDSKKHYHMIVRLHGSLPTGFRLAWELYLRSDAFRSVNNFIRLYADYDEHPSLLITSQPYDGFYRLPDDNCQCQSKHTQEVMSTCGAAARIRGDKRCADYFGKPKPMDSPIKFGRMEL